MGHNSILACTTMMRFHFVTASGWLHLGSLCPYVLYKQFSMLALPGL